MGVGCEVGVFGRILFRVLSDGGRIFVVIFVVLRY